ncbi:hypothetical protein OPV22_007278 [Ensete ventricosum]|uniref:Uncharacterized protein n=1 Tax=Ensete ventricosum TaxID=4639 RepID=A0AAV8QE24_ENSVE|nr:hypothetical protein OPV22_007278 [Ensete ventricosum]
MTSSWNLDRILKVFGAIVSTALVLFEGFVPRCVDRGRSLPASYEPLADEPWTTGTRGCTEDPQYCNWCTFPSSGRYKVSLFGHGAFEGPSTSTDIKSGTPTREPAHVWLVLLQEWVVGGAEQGGSTTIKKSKAGRVNTRFPHSC